MSGLQFAGGILAGLYVGLFALLIVLKILDIGAAKRISGETIGMILAGSGAAAVLISLIVFVLRLP